MGESAVLAMKRCGQCAIDKELSQFGRNKNKPDGLQGLCKECRAANYQRDRIEINGRRVARYQANPEPVKEQNRDYNSRNKERIAAQRAAAYWADPKTAIAKTMANYRLDPSVAWARNIKRKYGMIPAQYNALLEYQQLVCAICGSDKPKGRAGDTGHFHIDHAHVSGWDELSPDERRTHVRGLLCNPCNTALGLFEERPKIFSQHVQDYLKRRPFAETPNKETENSGK
jgi:Recombination endonuclease VII